jgi:hypothetical protein
MTCNGTEFCFYAALAGRPADARSGNKDRLLTAAERRVNAQLRARRTQPVNPPRQGPIVSATPTARDQPFHPSLSRLAVSRPQRAVNLPVIEAEPMVRDTISDWITSRRCVAETLTPVLNT